MTPIVPAAELWTWLRNSLRPSPSFVHFLLTHGRWFWEFVNATFIRDMLMRLVLTGGWRAAPRSLIWGAGSPPSSWNSWHPIRAVGRETVMPD